MEKVVTIENREIRLKVHGNVANLYEAQFGKDIFVEMDRMDKTGEVSLSMFNNFLWTCAKAANKEILPPDEWFESFESMPVIHCMDEVNELLEKMLPMGKLKTKAKPRQTRK